MHLESGGLGNRSMAEKESAAVLSEGAALAETLSPVVYVPHWSIPEYCARHG